MLRRPRKALPAAKSSSLGPKARKATDPNCSDGLEKRSRPPNPARWAQIKKGYRARLLRRRRKTLPPTKSTLLGPKARQATEHDCSDGVAKRFQPPNPARWAPKREGLATATAQMASKDAPAHQIQPARPQSEKGYHPELLRWRRKSSKTSSRCVKQGKLATTNLHHATRATTPQMRGHYGIWGPYPTPRNFTNGLRSLRGH